MALPKAQPSSSSRFDENGIDEAGRGGMYKPVLRWFATEKS